MRVNPHPLRARSLSLGVVACLGLAWAVPAAAVGAPDPAATAVGAPDPAARSAGEPEPGAGVSAQPSVLVLAFRVHSAKPIDYLGESLANLVRSRLEASGRVRVLDPGAAAAAAPGSGGPTGDAALRRVAARAGAAWVVTGSVTELAGRYSLDVRMTPEAPGLEAQTLVLTADADDVLLSRVNEVADGVVERVAGSTPPVVARVSIEGAGNAAGQLLPKLGTRSGGAYDSATVRDDLALLRAEPGVASAAVETERGPDGIVVRYRLTLGGAPRGPSRAGGIAEVRVRGNRRIESAAILARVATRAGGTYRSAQIARDVREINALGFFRNVRVFREQTPAGFVVVFEVEENPVVRQISISGNENVEGDKIRDILTLTTGSTLDYPLLFENRERIAALYRAQGYYLAEVSYEIDPLAEHAVGIHFVVDENEKLKLRKIEFVGNEAFGDDELVQDFQTKRWRWWSYATSWFDRSGTYAEPLFLQDLQTVQKRYADAGYLQAEIGEPKVIPSPEGLDVKVHISEGLRFDVGSIAIAGDETVDVEKLKQRLLLKEGDVFNRTYLSDSVTLLTEYYTNRGFYFANVQPLSNVSDTDQVVDVIFQVRKGPLYFIREIDISGNTVTVDPVVRREVALVEGELYSQRAVMLSRLRIEGSGYFEEVDIQMQPTEVSEQLDMEVRVVERPTGSFSFGAGYSSQDGIVGTGSLQQSNLFGRGFATTASVEYGGETQRFYLSLTDPYFLGSEWSLSVTGFSTLVNFESYEQSQIGGEFSLGHALTEDKRNRLDLRYSYQRKKLVDERYLTGAALILREFEGGWRDVSMLGISVQSDTRNDRFAPTEGWDIGANLDGAGLLGFAKFARAELRAIFYLGAPRWLLPNSSFVVGTRLGYAYPFNSISDFGLAGSPLPHDDTIRPLTEIDTNLKLPLSERYILGGLGEFQLRGFRARSVGPRRPILRPGQSAGLYLPLEKEEAGVRVYSGEGNNYPDILRQEVSTYCPVEPCNGIDQVNNIYSTDVIGGNQFISSTLEYRFPISETLGLQGLVFFDTGNAFAEDELLFDVTDWRYGTGVGVQWFSPFGPLAVIMGFPLDKLAVEDSPVFEFSMGGADF